MCVLFEENYSPRHEFGRSTKKALPLEEEGVVGTQLFRRGNCIIYCYCQTISEKKRGKGYLRALAKKKRIKWGKETKLVSKFCIRIENEQNS